MEGEFGADVWVDLLEPDANFLFVASLGLESEIPTIMVACLLPLADFLVGKADEKVQTGPQCPIFGGVWYESVGGPEFGEGFFVLSFAGDPDTFFPEAFGFFEEARGDFSCGVGARRRRGGLCGADTGGECRETKEQKETRSRKHTEKPYHGRASIQEKRAEHKASFGVPGCIWDKAQRGDPWTKRQNDGFERV